MRTSSRLTLAALATLVLAACGTPESETEPTTSDTDPAASATDAETEPEADAEAEPEVEPGTDPGTDGEREPAAEPDLAVGATELGDVLVDGDGMTLYLFTQDPDGESVCEDDCLAAWPPLLVEDDPTPGDGVDESLVSTITRDEGAIQVTYDGAPLYTWASDQEPGDVTGQGVQDVWFVVAPDGSAIRNVEDSSQSDSDVGSTAPDY